MLLVESADVNARPGNDYGSNALQIAARNGYLSVARRLLDLEADINAQRAWRGWRTALEDAAENGRLEMLDLLLSEGAQITGDSRTQFIRAVKLAERSGHGAAAMLLKCRGGWTEEDSGQHEEEDVESEYIEDIFTVYPDYSDDEGGGESGGSESEEEEEERW